MPMLSIGENCYRYLPKIEADLWNDEIAFDDNTLCRWADRRFAKANRDADNRQWRRSKDGIWLPL
jgi:hypothetical protein